MTAAAAELQVSLFVTHFIGLPNVYKMAKNFWNISMASIEQKSSSNIYFYTKGGFIVLWTKPCEQRKAVWSPGAFHKKNSNNKLNL